MFSLFLSICMCLYTGVIVTFGHICAKLFLFVFDAHVFYSYMVNLIIFSLVISFTAFKFRKSEILFVLISV